MTTSSVFLLNPPLKWVGGKRWLVPYLQPLWYAHRHRRLVEPFCGGLSVSLSLAPKKALLNDSNQHLMNFYRWLKRGLHSSLVMENDKTLYYQHRETFNRLITTGQHESKEAAELFYFLNRTDFNGLCRFSRKQGTFNVPFGRYKTITYVRDFTLYQRLFASWTFNALPFEQLSLASDDFLYVDPPYDDAFTHYTQEGFSWSDQVRLAEWLVRHPGPIVASNQATKRIVALYQDLGFTLRFLRAPRLINCTGDRTPAEELLAIRGFA